MNMVRHDHGCVEATFSIVGMNAGFESQVSCGVR